MKIAAKNKSDRFNIFFFDPPLKILIINNIKLIKKMIFEKNILSLSREKNN